MKRSEIERKVIDKLILDRQKNRLEHKEKLFKRRCVEALICCKCGGEMVFNDKFSNINDTYYNCVNGNIIKKENSIFKMEDVEGHMIIFKLGTIVNR